MTDSAMKSSIVPLVVAFAAIAAISYVHYHSFPNRGVSEQTENMVRGCIKFMGLWVVPVMIFLSLRAWARINSELKFHRNVAGLASLGIVSAVWLSNVFVPVLGSIWPNISVGSAGLEWNATLADSSLAAGLLAIALKGASRTHAVTAALLEFAHLQSRIYL
jgi:hypothetical protein